MPTSSGVAHAIAQSTRTRAYETVHDIPGLAVPTMLRQRTAENFVPRGTGLSAPRSRDAGATQGWQNSSTNAACLSTCKENLCIIPPLQYACVQIRTRIVVHHNGQTQFPQPLHTHSHEPPRQKMFICTCCRLHHLIHMSLSFAVQAAQVALYLLQHIDWLRKTLA